MTIIKNIMTSAVVKIKKWLDGLAEQKEPENDADQSIQASAIRLARRIFVTIVGGTVLLIGIAMSVLPGPAFIVIPLGIAILASEFVWARRILNWIMKMIDRIRRWWSKRKK